MRPCGHSLELRRLKETPNRKTKASPTTERIKDLFSFLLAYSCFTMFGSFCSTAKWISCMYSYILSFLDFLPISVTTEHWVQFPELYSRLSFVIYFIHSMYMSVPTSQFIPSSFPPWYLCFCSLHLCHYFCFINKIIYTNSFKLHIYALIYDICFPFFDLIHSV